MSLPVHGGDIFFKDIDLDFSVNINPLGMPESIRYSVISNINKWENYPDPYCRELRYALSLREGFREENIVAGNGAADLIYRIVNCLKPKKCLLPVPSFSEYEKALSECGCEIIYYYLDEENDFSVDSEILELVDESIQMIFLASPNNPTGKIISAEILRELSEKCGKMNITLVVDECFLDFAENGDKFSVRRYMNDNIIIIKAFTKIYAMAGLRIGYGLFGSEKTAEKIFSSGQYWSVSVPAQHAGIAAAKEKKYVEKTIELITKERQYLSESLRNMGFRVVDSDVNFILFYCNLPLDTLLIKEKILIRNCGNYRNLKNGYFRISVKNHNENLMLIKRIRRIING